MKKLRMVQYLAYFTIVIISISIFSGNTLAAKGSSDSEDENQNQMRENSRGSYTSENEIERGSNSSEFDSKKSREELRIDSQKTISEREEEKIKEDLKLQKEEYQKAKEDFIKTRNSIKTGKLDINSEEALDATKSYLDSSISYMIAHLSSVKNNIEHSNGKGTYEKIEAIDEKIKLLEDKRAELAATSSQDELLVVVRSVREIWGDAQKISLAGSGEIVSERVGEFLEKSENLSEKLEIDIENLNKTGIDTSDLETKLTSYNSYIRSAEDKREKADSIYSDENVTQENMKIANNYLRQSISDINRANKMLKEIFGELKKHEVELAAGTIKDELDTGFNSSKIMQSNNTSSTIGVTPVK